MYATPITTVQIGKHAWVSGLTWVPLTKQRDLVADAKAQMAKFGGSAFVVRHSAGVAQVGIAGTDDAISRGVLTLAGAVADTVAMRDFPVNGRRQRLQDWIGLFEVAQDKWFLIAVRDGAIVPNCDRIGTYHEAYDLLEQTYSVGGWTAVLGSPSITEDAQASYHNFIPVAIEDVLGLRNSQLPKAGRYALRTPGNPKAKLIAVAIAGLVLVAAGTGYFLYQQYLDRKAAEELAALQAEMANATQVAGEKVQIAIPHGWVNVPTPSSLIAACMADLEIPAAPGSWDLTSYVCEPTGSTVNLSRHDNTNVGYLKALLPEAVVASDQNSATWSRTFQTLDSQDESLSPWVEMETLIFARMQTANISISVGAPTPPPAPPIPEDQVDKVEVLPADWVERSVQVGPTPLMPQTIREMFDFPGVRLTKITAQEGQWTYEGTIYAK